MAEDVDSWQVKGGTNRRQFSDKLVDLPERLVRGSVGEPAPELIVENDSTLVSQGSKTRQTTTSRAGAPVQDQ
jgi:hypothetical protein